MSLELLQKLTLLQFFIILVIFSLILPFVPAISKKFRKRLDLDSIKKIVVGGVLFSVSFIFSMRVILFVAFKEYVQYNLPDDVTIFIAVGGLFTAFYEIISYYSLVKKSYKLEEPKGILEGSPRYIKNKRHTINLFQEKISQIEDLGGHDTTTTEFQAWKNSTENLIIRCFGKKSHFYSNFKEIAFTNIWLSYKKELSVNSCQEGLQKAKGLLQACIESIS